MVTNLVGVLILILIVALDHIRNGTVPQSSAGQPGGAMTAQAVDYSGSLGGVILVGMFGFSYFLAIALVVAWFVVH